MTRQATRLAGLRFSEVIQMRSMTLLVGVFALQILANTALTQNSAAVERSGLK